MFRDILYGICNFQIKQIEKKQQDLTLDTEKVILTRNQPYQENYSPYHLYDVYQPRAVADPFQLPLIISIHGGAFITGDKKYHRYFSGFIASHNYQIASINFRPVSEDTNLKDQIQDIFTAINDVVKLFKGFSRLYIVGESSGALLATLVCSIWNNQKLQKKFHVSIPNCKVSGLALIACPYSNQLFPKFLSSLNNKNNKMLFTRCSELKNVLDVQKIWNSNMPPVFMVNYDKDLFYKRQLDFESFLKKKKYAFRSLHITQKNSNIKLFHTFNIIRPDYEVSEKINLAMLTYFDEIAHFKNRKKHK